MAAEAAALVRIPSVTGAERAALERLAERRAGRSGCAPTLIEHDLAAVRAADGWPGEEVARDELLTLEVVLPGADPAAARLALCAHVDVVPRGHRALVARRRGPATSPTASCGGGGAPT